MCELEGCDKKFFMRKRLRAHMKTHLNQKDFLCNYCEKSYFSQVRERNLVQEKNFLVQKFLENIFWTSIFFSTEIFVLIQEKKFYYRIFFSTEIFVLAQEKLFNKFFLVQKFLI